MEWNARHLSTIKIHIGNTGTPCLYFITRWGCTERLYRYIINMTFFISYIILYNANETRTLIENVNSTTLLSMTRDKVGDIGKNDVITLNKYGIIAFWERSSVSPWSVVCWTKEPLVPCFNVFGMTRSSNTRRHHSTTSLSRHWHSLQPSC